MTGERFFKVIIKGRERKDDLFIVTTRFKADDALIYFYYGERLTAALVLANIVGFYEVSGR